MRHVPVIVSVSSGRSSGGERRRQRRLTHHGFLAALVAGGGVKDEVGSAGGDFLDGLVGLEALMLFSVVAAVVIVQRRLGGSGAAARGWWLPPVVGRVVRRLWILYVVVLGREIEETLGGKGVGDIETGAAGSAFFVAGGLGA